MNRPRTRIQRREVQRQREVAVVAAVGELSRVSVLLDRNLRLFALGRAERDARENEHQEASYSGYATKALHQCLLPVSEFRSSRLNRRSSLARPTAESGWFA